MERDGDGHAIAALRPGARLAPRILGRGALVRAALVPTQAGPLAGDRDAVELRVGAGARLWTEPVAATVALPGPAPAVLELDVAVGAGGVLVLDEPPLIVAGGARVVRRTRIVLGQGAVAVVRDAVVLGRHGEPPGELDASLRVAGPGGVLLHDALRLGPRSAHEEARVALAPGERVVGSVCVLGVAPAGDDDDPRVLRLAGPGALRRATGAGLAGVERELAVVWRSWSALGRPAGRRSGAPAASGSSAG